MGYNYSSLSTTLPFSIKPLDTFQKVIDQTLNSRAFRYGWFISQIDEKKEEIRPTKVYCIDLHSLEDESATEIE